MVNRKESFKITNTAKLANRVLNNSDLHIYGRNHEPFDFNLLLDSEKKPLLLFPFEGSQVLSESILSGGGAAPNEILGNILS